MKKILVVSVFAALFATSAMAGSYKSAGCGLGSMVIKEDGIIQVFAVTTNGTSGSQTFGITSGTSNCSGSGGYAKADAAQEMYVSSNLDTLSQEMAQGSGEHLNALASLFGCEKNANDNFSAALRKNYRSIVGQEAKTDRVIEGVKAAVSSDPVLNKSCNNG
jgi:hypothetical protein